MSEALILCGGLGTRLRSVVPDRPKVLAPVAGRPFVAHVLDQLAAAGVTRAVLCTGYMAEEVERTLGARHGSMQLAYAVETTPLGTAGALKAALPWLKGDQAFVVNGDSILDAPLADMPRETAVVALAEVPDTARYGRVVLEGDRIVRFEEKAPGAGLINAGVYLIHRRRLEALPPPPLSLERDVFPRWIAGEGLSGWRSGGQLLDIGIPESYAQAADFLARRRFR